MAPPLSLQRVVERFVRAFDPQRILLFGSYAKGTQRPGSDLDLLVVAECGEDPASPLARARQLAADCYPHVDVVFASPAEVDRAEHLASPFLLSILGTGVTLYERREAAARPPGAGNAADRGP